MNRYEQACVKAAMNQQFYERMDVQRLKDNIMQDIDMSLVKLRNERTEANTSGRMITDRTSIKQSSNCDIGSQNMKLNFQHEHLQTTGAEKSLNLVNSGKEPTIGNSPLNQRCHTT